jgi:CheY-like chemotaxis protein
MPGRGQQRPLHVLIVEDNEDVADDLALFLELQGHRVRQAHDAGSALEAAAGHPPDAVVLDIGSPGMDGYAVARRLRAQGPARPHIIALTTYRREEDRRRSGEEGFHFHLVKPVDPVLMHDLIVALAGLPPPS